MVDTPVARLLAANDSPSTIPANIATIIIKTESAAETLVLKMRCTDTLAELRRNVDAHRQGCDKCRSAGAGRSNYRLLTSYPRQVGQRGRNDGFRATLIPVSPYPGADGGRPQFAGPGPDA